MARPVRLDFEGALWHVTARGNERKPVFRDEEDYRVFLEVLADVVTRYGWNLFAYVLMPNHYHLLLETPAATLSRGMRQLGGVYTQRFNRKWSRCGHLFQGRFFSLHVERESHLLELARYLALNPVRGGLVRDPAGWPWGSYRSLAALDPVPPFLRTAWLREMFRSRRRDSHEAFAEFVAARNDYAPWPLVRHQVYLGSEAFCAERLERARNGAKRDGVSAGQVRGFAPDPAELRKRLLGGKSPLRVGLRERNLIALVLREETLATYRDIGVVIGLTAEGARAAIADARRRLAGEGRSRADFESVKARVVDKLGLSR